VIKDGESVASKNRSDGFMRAAGEKGLKVLSASDMAKGKTRDAVKEFLKDQNLRGIFATSDEAAIEASRAVFDEGRFNDVIVVGYGGKVEALDEIKKNRIVATVAPNFKLLGRTAAGLAINAALGTIQYVSPKDMTVPPTVVSKSVLEGK
jgi:ABC-type sugar transport system substrate-binding protein